TSPRLIDCDIVVSSQVGVRYISSSVAPCPATLRFDAALQEQPAGQLRRNRQVSVPELLTWEHPFARVPTMEPPLHRMEPWLQVVFETRSGFQLVMTQEVHEFLVFLRRQIEERQDPPVVARRFAQRTADDRAHLRTIEIALEERLTDGTPEVLAA